MGELFRADRRDCMRCEQQGRRTPASLVVVNVIDCEPVETPLCAKHTHEWRAWRDLIYRSARPLLS